MGSRVMFAVPHSVAFVCSLRFFRLSKVHYHLLRGRETQAENYNNIQNDDDDDKTKYQEYL